MPTYDYRCEKCGRFQVTQRITEPPLEKCPTCGQPVQRLISRNVGIIFKGSGFHITDYRSEEYKKRAKEESKSEGEAKKSEVTASADSK